MAKVDEKVNATQFTVQTRLAPDKIREAAQRATGAGKRFMGSTITETGASANGIDYVIKGPGNVLKQMAFKLTWTDDPADGKRQVRLSVHNYLTTRETVFFIPVSPKSAPALVSLQRFAETLRQELTAG